MTREEYERDICARSHTACLVPVKRDAGFDGWKPKVGDCHNNVDYWVKHHDGHTAVRGWMACSTCGPGYVVYTAHSVVRDRDGALFDITPREHDEELRGHFIVHEGDDAAFLYMRTQNLNISCQGNCPALPFVPLLTGQDYRLKSEEWL